MEDEDDEDEDEKLPSPKISDTHPQRVSNCCLIGQVWRGTGTENEESL